MKRLVASPIILISLMAGALPLFATSSAEASPAYPTLVQKYFQMQTPPQCTLCHKSLAGGPGNINDKVGAYLEGDPVNLVQQKGDIKEYLAKWDATQDSDGGGEPDVAELKAARDPNGSGDDKSDGSSGGSAGSGGSGGGGDDDDDDDDSSTKGSGGSGGSKSPTNQGTQGQATSAGCSYGVLDRPTRAGSLAFLTGVSLACASLTRRRKRR